MNIKQFLNLELFERPSFKWLILIELFTAICIIATILISASRPVKIPPDPTFQKEMRKANEDLRRAYENQAAENEKRMVFLEKKDILLRSQMAENKTELQKVKKTADEKIKAINNYGADDIRRAFANLP